MKKHLLFSCLTSFLLISTASAQEDLSLLKFYQYYSDAPNALYKHICEKAFDHLEERKNTIARLDTETDWKDRQAAVRKQLAARVGPFPEKQPLNPQITEVIQKDGYRVEKLYYESMPQFYVTAALFIPDDLKGKAPAILFCSGHTPLAFRSEAYQTIILNLVRKGFIVLAFDPIGQGERLQYPDKETQKSIIGGPTHEHSYVGAQCFISGSSLARYMIWDGIRSIDYLLTREEVDPQRIGIAGRSGGGTQSAYIAAFDERIVAAAPEAYITSLEYLLKTRGPQDAEQNFYHGIAHGLDHADLLEVRAPKPALIISTTRDIFSIQGARNTYQEVKQVYRAYGKEEHLSMVEDDAAHSSTLKNREALYAFFQQHLQLPGNPNDEPVTLLDSQTLQVTPTGQVVSSLGGETVFSLNKKETEATFPEGKNKQQIPLDPKAIVDAARKLSGYKEPVVPEEVHFAGRYLREGYAVEKYLLVGEDHVNPFLFFRPEGDVKAVMLYLHPEGKAAEAAPGGEIESLVLQGFGVVAPDILGIGELGSGYLQGDSHIEDISYNLWFGSILVNQSIVAWQAADIIKMVRVIQRRENVEEVYAIARGALTPVLLHAAAFEPQIVRIALVNPLISYRSLVDNQYYQPYWVPSSVAGALTAYDLPDLAAVLVPRQLIMIDVQDQQGLAAAEALENTLSVVQSAYADNGKFIVLKSSENQTVIELLFSWLE